MPLVRSVYWIPYRHGGRFSLDSLEHSSITQFALVDWISGRAVGGETSQETLEGRRGR